jgi:hypothetical protein
LYRGLLSLYPADFRKQFSEEMLCVFEQRAGERFANRRFLSVDFVLAEFSSVMKGAYTMWLEKIPPLDRQLSESEVVASTDISSTDVSGTIAELMNQREAAIQKMVTCIATHDFVHARRYSYEETRLTNLLQKLQNEKSVEHGISVARSDIVC